MSNRKKLEIIIHAEGMKIGCYSDLMENLNKKEFQKVLDNVWGYADTDVKINRKDFVVQIDNVDDEVDFTIISKSEYINRYGNERYEED
jgi:hypothetical protein